MEPETHHVAGPSALVSLCVVSQAGEMGEQLFNFFSPALPSALSPAFLHKEKPLPGLRVGHKVRVERHVSEQHG